MRFQGDTEKWAKHVYGGCRLGDKRRTKRVVEYASVQARNPSASIPTVCEGDAAAQEGAYRLLENDLVDPQAIEEGVSRRALRDAAGRPVVLAVQDTTTLTYSHSLRRELGDVGTSVTKGMLVHSVLLVSPDDNEVIGVGAQKWWVRSPDRPGKKKRKKVPYHLKESYKWESTLRQLLERTNRKDNLISVCDREADIYALLQFHHEEGLRYVIRACRHRALETPKGGLRTVVKNQPVLGYRNVVIEQRGPGIDSNTLKKRPPRSRRTARTAVRACSVVLGVGRRRENKLRKPLPLNVVLVTEVDPPTDVEPLNWLLLTTEPVGSLEEAIRVVNYYEHRWEIEEFHKCWKTGCALRQKRLQHVGNLERLMVILAPIAVRLLQLRTLHTSTPEASCEQFMSRAEWGCLWLHENPRKKKLPTKAPALDWAVMAVARIGGWTDTKRTGKIGWQTLWKGWLKLEEMVDGFKIALRMQGVKL